MKKSKRHNGYDYTSLCSENLTLLMEVDNSDSKVQESKNSSDLMEIDHERSPYETFTIEQAVEAAGMGWFQIKLVIMVGVLSAADAMEMLLLSILGPALQCEWHLSSGQKALITTIVFIGFLFGSFFWGFVSDNYGRKTTFLIVVSLISYMGFHTSFSPNYAWLILLRCAVGFGIGGAASSFTLLSEFLPSQSRAKTLIVYQIWWACGSSFEVGLAYLILPRYGWRWVVGLSSVPIVLCAILILWLPESPRFLLSVGKLAESQKIIDKMLTTNSKPLMKGHLIYTGKLQKSNIKNLFSKEYRCTFFLLLILWFGVTFSYYGIVLLNAEFFNLHHTCYQAPSSTSFHYKANMTFQDVSCCKTLDGNDYKSMLLSSFGEFFIIPINFFLVDFVGRKGTMSISFFFTSVFFMLLYICMPNIWATVLMFGIRGFTSGIFNITYIYTSEVFPTGVRSSATGMCSSFARIAAIVTPFVAQVLIPKSSMLIGLIVYASIAFLCFVSVISLPIETKGRPMPQNFLEDGIEMDVK